MAELLKRILVYVLISTLVLPPAAMARGGITADAAAQAGKRPGVSAAGNGVPLVNITAPNASGLSHNQYSDFNVQKQGAILNNSTVQQSQSKLGGLVLGNKNLVVSGPAGVILNEVTSSNRSHIQGYIEVHGQKADVILANPNGITINGGGFINSGRATVTTGRPEFDAAGRLESFEVRRGDVRIEGEGINAGNLTGFDIVARAAEINANIYANELNIVTGQNRYSPSTGLAAPLSGDGSSRPGVAIDSSALGGMYAGRIRLTSNETGVGVNLQGLVQAAGDLEITSAGRLALRSAQAGGDLGLASKSDLSVSASALAHKNLVAQAQNIALNNAVLGAGESLTLNAAEKFSASGSEVLGLKLAELQAAEIALSNTKLQGDELKLQSKKLLADGSVVAAQGRLEAVAGSEASLSGGSRLVGLGSAELSSAKITLDDASLEGGLVSVTSKELTLNKGLALAENGLTVNAPGKISLLGDSLLAGKTGVRLAAGELLLEGGGLEGAELELRVEEDLGARGGARIIAQNSAVLSARHLALDEATLGAGESLNVHAAEKFSASGSEVLGLKLAELQAAEIALSNSKLQGDELKLQSKKLLAENSVVAAQGRLEAVAGSEASLSGGSRLVGLGSAELSSAKITLDDASLEGGLVSVKTKELTLNKGLALAENGLTVNAPGKISLLGDSLLAGKTGVRLAAGELLLEGGGLEGAELELRVEEGLGARGGARIIAQNSAVLSARHIALNNAVLGAGESLTLNAAEKFSASGSEVLGLNSATLQAAEIALSNTKLQGDELKLQSKKLLADGSVVAAQGRLEAVAGSEASLSDGSRLVGLGSAELSSAKIILDDASLEGGLVSVKTKELTLNKGLALAENGLTVNAPGKISLLGDSLLAGKTGVRLTAGELLLEGGGLEGAELELRVEAGLGARGGARIIAQNSAVLSTMHLALDEATLGAGESLNVHAAEKFSASGSEVFGLNSTTLQAAEIALSNTKLQGDELKLQSKKLLADGSVVAAQGRLEAVAGSEASLSGGSRLVGLGSAELSSAKITLDDASLEGGLVSVKTKELTLTGGAGLSGEDMDVEAGAFALRRGHLAASGDLGLKTAGHLDLSGENSIIGQKSLRIEAASITADEKFTLEGGDLALSAAADITLNQGAILAGGDAVFKARNLTNNSGLFYAAGNLGFKIGQNLNNLDGADILAGGDISFGGALAGSRMGALHNRASSVESLYGDIGVQAATFFNDGGAPTTRRVSGGSEYKIIGWVGDAGTLLHDDENNYYRISDADNTFNIVGYGQNDRPIITRDTEDGSTPFPWLRGVIPTAIYDHPEIPYYPYGADGEKNYLTWRYYLLKSPRAVAEYLKRQYDLYGIPAQTAGRAEGLQEWRDYSYDELLAPATPSRFMAGRNLALNADSVTNAYSTISAGGDINIAARKLANTGLELSRHMDIERAFMSTGPSGTRIIASVDKIFYDHTELMGSVPAVISAGGRINIAASEQVDNSVIKAGGDYIGTSAGTPGFSAFPGGGDLPASPGLPESDIPAGGGLPTGAALPGASGITAGGGLSTGADLLGGSWQGGIKANPEWMPDFNLGGLFKPSANPGHNYVIETNPRLANLGSFYGSEYFFGQIGYHLPREQIRLLGDAFFETRLVREQVLAQSGRRYLFGGVSDDAATMLRLMENAAREYAGLRLSVGVSLTPEQIARLGSDIIWLEEVDYNGRKALAPRLYLCEATRAGIALRGANINGSGVTVESAFISNQGGVSGETVELSASGDIFNKGGNIFGSSALLVDAGGSIVNRSGVFGGGDISLTAGRDVRFETFSGQFKSGAYGNTALAGQPSVLNASGNLNIRSGGDIEMLWTKIDAGGAAGFEAGGNINLASQAMTTSGGWLHSNYSYTTQFGSLLEAGSLSLKAGGNIMLTGSELRASGDASLQAGGGITALSAWDEAHRYFHASRSGSKVTLQYDASTALGSLISSGGNLSVTAGGALAAAGSGFRSGGDLSVSANGLVFDTAENRLRTFSQSSSKGFLSKKSSVYVFETVDNIGSFLSAGGGVSLQTGGNAYFRGAGIEAGRDVRLDVGGDISLMAAHDRESRYKKSSKSSFGGLIKEVDIKFDENTLLAGTKLTTRDGLDIVAGHDVNVKGSALEAGGDAVILAGYRRGADGLEESGLGGSVNVVNDFEEVKAYSFHEEVNYLKSLPDILTGDLSAVKLDFSGGKFQASLELGSAESTENDVNRKNVAGSSLKAGGDLALGAAGDINVVGSALEAGGDAVFEAGDINLLAEYSLEDTKFIHEQSKISLTAGVGNAYVDAALALKALGEATRAVNDSRKNLNKMRDLRSEGRASDAAVKDAELDLAMAVANEANAVISLGMAAAGAAAASGTGMGTGLYASAGLSYAGTRTESATRTHASVGSSVVSAGDIVFSASGDMAQIGSDALSKEASVYYEIGRDLLLAASDNTYSSRSKTSSKSASVSVGTNGVGSAGVGVSRGKTSSMEVVWDNAASTAQNGSIVYDEGNDMRADGYNALAGRITAGVGGGLDLFSKQGSTESSGSSSGFNAGISSGLYASANAGIIAGTSVDGGFSQSKESGNRNWVDDRSSLIGTESVEISARGSLRLAGSQIANVKNGVDGGNLRIFAGDLSWEDIKNTQEERSAGFGLQTGFSLTGDKKAGAGGALVPLGPGNERAGVTRDSGGEYKSGGTTLTAGHGGRELEGLTLATVGQGEITLGSGRDISGLNRDVTAMDVITGDVVTGALEAEVTLDHRLLSAAGREEIAGQVSALPENLAQSAEGAAKGAANLGKATADSVTAIGEGLFGGSGLGEAFAQADRQIAQMQADHEFRVQYAEMQTALDDPNASFEAKRDALEKKHEIDKKYNLAHPGSEAILYALQNDVYQDEDGSWRFRQGSSFSADDLNLLGINLSDSGGLIIDGRTLAAVKAHEGRESQTGSLDERTAHAQANKAAEYAAKNHDWANWLNGVEGKDVQTAVDDWLADGNASSAALAAGDLLYLLLEGDQTRNMYDSTSISFEMSAILDPEAGDPRRVTYWEAAYYVAAANAVGLGVDQNRLNDIIDKCPVPFEQEHRQALLDVLGNIETGLEVADNASGLKGAVTAMIGGAVKLAAKKGAKQVVHYADDVADTGKTAARVDVDDAKNAADKVDVSGAFTPGRGLTDERYQHIFKGEIRTNPKDGNQFASGGHYLNNNIQIDKTIYEADANGVIKAKISVRNEQGKWVQKDAATSIFPTGWSERRTATEIESAFAKRVDVSDITGKKNTWRGVSPSGVVIEGGTYPDGSISTAYPVHANDLKVRTKPEKL